MGGVLRVLLVLVLVALPVAGGWWLVAGRTSTSDRPLALSDPLVRSAMRVSVIEGGSLEALESEVIRSEVEGKREILSIVPEGTLLTPEDVAEGRVIVRLADSDLVTRLQKQAIDVSAATNGRNAAQNNLEIQRQTNASDLRKARLEVRFAELDLTRYVGETVVLGLLRRHADSQAGDGEATSTGDDGSTERLVPWIRGLLADESLSGEALQKRRTFESDIRLAKEELGRAQVRLNWSEQLQEKGYTSLEELEADRLALQRREIELDRAQTASRQYAVYDFPKEVERLLSELVDKRDHLRSAETKAASSLEKATSELDTKERQLRLQEAQLAQLETYRAACVIKATHPGLVVYASSGKERRWHGNDRIQEGATIRRRQAIIRIPKPGRLAAQIDVHETLVDRVAEELPARITIDALPGTVLDGVVRAVAELPNPADRWLNPTRKVYTTKIEVLGNHPTLKPGMSVRVEIVLEDIQDQLQVPIQAVAGTMEAPVVFVQAKGGAIERRPVELGPANERFVAIARGVSEGERVLLAPPDDKDKDPADKDPARTGPDARKKGASGKRPARGGA